MARKGSEQAARITVAAIRQDIDETKMRRAAHEAMTVHVHIPTHGHYAHTHAHHHHHHHAHAHDHDHDHAHEHDNAYNHAYI